MYRKLAPLILPILIYAVALILVDMEPIRYAYSLAMYGYSIVGLLLLLFTENKTVIHISFFCIYILLFLKLFFLLTFKSYLNSDAICTLFSSNISEALEFLGEYFDFTIIIFIGTLFFSFLFSLRAWDTKFYPMNKKLLLSIILIVNISYFKIPRVSQFNILYNLVLAHEQYKNTEHLFKKDLSSKFTKNTRVYNSQATGVNHIVIIGESTSRAHMSLYNYHRKTNPYLNSIKDRLTIFNDVISPHTHTILALDKILTSNSYENNSKLYSVVQLANNAGFFTSWISNQQPVGIHESMASIISNACDDQFYSTKNHFKPPFDEILIPELIRRCGNKNNNKKVIFIHLMGTHIKYKNRYPKKFEFFNKKTKNSKQETVNQYDNANRYNDFIIYNIIKSVEKLNTPSTVTYFSDHGDEVYDVLSFHGHNESIGSRSMYEVPFFIWQSKEHEKAKGLFSQSHINKKYNLEDFIYTLSDILDINHSEQQKEKSIINSNFQEKKRIIRTGDYDIINTKLD